MKSFSRIHSTKIATAGLLASALFLSACGGTGSTDADQAGPAGTTGPASIVVAEQGTADTLTGLLPHLADELGFFAEQGVSVKEYVVVAKGADAITGMVSNSVQVSHIGAEGMILASAGGGVVGIGANTGASQWTVVAAPGITSWADLKGKTVALGSTADITRAVFDKLARTAGLDPEVDLEYVGLGATPQRVAAVQNGQVAATLATFPAAARVIEAGLTDLGFSPEGTDAPALMTTDIEASKEWVDDHPDQVTAYLRALHQTLEYIRDPANEQEVAEIASSLNGEPVDLMLDAIDRYFRDPAVAESFFPADFHHAPGAFDATVDAYLELGLMKERITEDEYVDYSFADEAVGK